MICDFKGAFSGLRQFSATESFLKLTKNVFYFTLNSFSWYLNLRIFKYLILRISGSIVFSFIQFAFIACEIHDCQNILKLICRPVAFTSYKAFLKNKKTSRISLPPWVSCMIFEGKYLSCYILLHDRTSFSTTFCAWIFWKNTSVIIHKLTKFCIWLPLLFEMLGNRCTVIEQFHLHDKKFKTKI